MCVLLYCVAVCCVSICVRINVYVQVSIYVCRLIKNSNYIYINIYNTKIRLWARFSLATYGQGLAIALAPATASATLSLQAQGAGRAREALASAIMPPPQRTVVGSD